jgi:hypothetical protein
MNLPPLTPKQSSSLYEQDYYQWIAMTVKQIRQGKLADVDWHNVLEELETLGRSEKRQLKSRLMVLIEHLLKLAYWNAERDYNARGWNNTIVEQRRQIELLLQDSPSLQPILADLLAECYAQARKDTSRKTGLDLDTFPDYPPFSLEQVLDFDYYL